MGDGPQVELDLCSWEFETYEAMISRSVQARTLTAQIIWAWSLERVTAVGSYVHKLIFCVEDRAMAVGAAIVTVCGEFRWRNFRVNGGCTLLKSLAGLRFLQ